MPLPPAIGHQGNQWKPIQSGNTVSFRQECVTPIRRQFLEQP
jgi:hypothetical protein